MSGILWSDGMYIRTDQEKYVIIRKRDGLYVVGKGVCCPVANRQEGLDFIKMLEGANND